MTLPKIDLDRRNVKLTFSQIVTIGSIVAWFATQFFTLRANNEWIETKGKPHVETSESSTRSAIQKEVETQVQATFKSEIEVLKEQMKTTGEVLRELKDDIKEFRKDLKDSKK